MLALFLTKTPLHGFTSGTIIYFQLVYTLRHCCFLRIPPQAVIEFPYVDDLSWPMLLKLKGLVDESARGHTPVSAFEATVPGLKTEKFSVPASWFGLSPAQQYELWLKGRQQGATGVTPGQLNVSGLFGPGYTAGTPPILFFDHAGQPFGANKQPDYLSLFGTRTTPVEKVPDYVAGQFSPAVSEI